MRFIDGSSYEGSWLNGKFNGQGALTYSDTSLLNIKKCDLNSLQAAADFSLLELKDEAKQAAETL